MKKLFISKRFILMLLFIVFLVFFEIPTSSAAELTQSEIVDKISETSGKIMKYNVITNETTEVNVEELKQKLKKDMGDTGYYRLKSHTPNLEPISLRPSPSNLFKSSISTILSSNADGFDRVYDTSQFPYQLVCKTTSKNFNTEYDFGATASIIGPKLTITAAHCLWDQNDNNYKLRDWVIYAGCNNGQYYGSSCGWINVYYNSNWMQTHEGKDDWAICEMGENIGNQLGWLRSYLLSFYYRAYWKRSHCCWIYRYTWI